MHFDAFTEEREIIKQAEEALAGDEAIDFRSRFVSLLEGYKKLHKASSRLVRMSDRNEEQLKQANSKVQKQQLELAFAHAQLAEHAESLETKVQERTKELLIAQEKLGMLINMGINLSQERDHHRFIEMILDGAKNLTNADGAMLLTLVEEGQLRCEMLRIDTLDMHFSDLLHEDIPFSNLSLDTKGKDKGHLSLPVHVALDHSTANIANAYACDYFDFGDFFAFDRQYGYQSISFLATPLKPCDGEIVGVLVLINARHTETGETIPFSSEIEDLVQALASQASVSMKNQMLIKLQKQLFDSVVKVTASAIDAKSPYTSGHCERVPEIGFMLARAACDCQDEPFAHFSMSEADWEEFRLASWLHDCGKVTTPEYVVDKATKLETIYNRIHEIRTRFEVKHRDYIIEYQQALLEGKEAAEVLKQALDERLAKLQEDFAFIAECNIGSEMMDAKRIEQLKQLSQITWLRHFDDRLGLSHLEISHLDHIPQPTLPVVEPLLADKPEHIIPRSKESLLPYDLDEHGFKIQVPDNVYNHGELYNLSISRGTLTEEERFKINEHIIHTIIMLKKLPFPKSMSRLVDIAGSHHETMLGYGYPRRLRKEDLSVQARILAIADIFEALTASDRPYKKAKTLSEALRIMGFMSKDQHIDSDLFELFTRKNIYLDYARKFLSQDQIDIS